MSELIQTYGPIFVDGFKITLFSSVLALVFSLIIGTLMAIFQLSKNKVVSALAKAYVEFFRNIPLLIIVMFFYVVVPIYWFNLDGFQAGTIGLTIYTSAFIAETVRSGIQTVPKGQTEAGLSSGFTYSEIMRYIVLPQAFKSMIPAIVSQLISLIKDTSLAVIISLPELSHQARIIYGQNTNYVLPMLLIMTLMYFVVCYALSLLSGYVEKRRYSY